MVKRWVAPACKLLAVLAGGGIVVLIVRRLAASGIAVTDRDVAPLLIIAALWLLFFVGLGAAHWRARRAFHVDAAGAGHRPRLRD